MMMMVLLRHEILVQVDNWDLRVHLWEATRVRNRRNVEVGSLENQPKPHTDKDSFFCHTRLGLVGWTYKRPNLTSGDEFSAASRTSPDYFELS
jgi:hypothetical protein